MTGTLAQYDDLCEALEAYEADQSERVMGSYMALRRAALRCGCPVDQPVLHWARRRRDTYRATVTGAVSHLQSVIEEVCP